MELLSIRAEETITQGISGAVRDSMVYEKNRSNGMPNTLNLTSCVI